VDINLTDIFYSIAALLFVIALIGLAGAAARRMGFGFNTPVKKGKKNRLSIVEMKSLDAKRRLVLLRRDDTEHLILLGGDTALLIENAITPPEETPEETEAADAPFSQTAPSSQKNGQGSNPSLTAAGKATT